MYTYIFARNYIKITYQERWGEWPFEVLAS